MILLNYDALWWNDNTMIRMITQEKMKVCKCGFWLWDNDLHWVIRYDGSGDDGDDNDDYNDDGDDDSDNDDKDDDDGNSMIRKWWW